MLSLINTYQSNAQKVCNGTFGKPLVNITFGAGNNPGPPLQAASAAYKYTTSDCPNDGEYTIRNNSIGCYYGDWHSVVKDHTGDSSGYFLLTNASALPTDFYLGTINDLCSSTIYQFEAWVLNITKPTSCGNGGAKPNITFKIEKSDGTLLDSFNTQDINTTTLPEWQRFRFTFSTSETNIVLRMHTNTVGGCGGDFAIDDISLSPCIGTIQTDSIRDQKTIAYHCKSKDTSFTFKNRLLNIYANPGYLWETSVDSGKNWLIISGETRTFYTKTFSASPITSQYLYRLSTGEMKNMGVPRCLVHSTVDTVRTVSEPSLKIPNDTTLCQNDTLVLIASGSSTYSWRGANNFTDTGDTVYINNLQAKHTGQYYVTTNSKEGCTATDSLTITVNEKPIVSAGVDQRIVQGSTTQLKATLRGTDISLRWTPNLYITNTTILQPFVTPIENTLYTITAISNKGCGTAIDAVWVFTNEKITIPNAFSPNKDGINDQWIISNLENFSSARVTVFNRYGQKVFSSFGTYNPWNGNYKGSPLPFATYYYIINLDNKKFPLTGSITIIR